MKVWIIKLKCLHLQPQHWKLRSSLRNWIQHLLLTVTVLSVTNTEFTQVLIFANSWLYNLTSWYTIEGEFLLITAAGVILNGDEFLSESDSFPCFCPRVFSGSFSFPPSPPASYMYISFKKKAWKLLTNRTELNWNAYYGSVGDISSEHTSGVKEGRAQIFAESYLRQTHGIKKREISKPADVDTPGSFPTNCAKHKQNFRPRCVWNIGHDKEYCPQYSFLGFRIVV